MSTEEKKEAKDFNQWVLLQARNTDARVVGELFMNNTKNKEPKA